MDRRRKGAAVAGMAALLFAAGASFGAGSAAAAALLIGSCGDEVTGAPGTPVAIAGGPVQLVQVGVVPEQGSAVLPLPALPLLGQSVCAVTATVAEPVNAAAAPVQDGATALGEAVGVPVSPLAPPAAEPAPPSPAASTGSPPAATLPAAEPYGPFLPRFAVGTPPAGGTMFDYAGFDYAGFDYASLFAASPGMFGNLVSGDLFGYTPAFGVLGAPGAGAAAEDVAAAGRVQALPAQSADRVALPVLAAVLLLSMVTAALARSWAHGATRTG